MTRPAPSTMKAAVVTGPGTIACETAEVRGPQDGDVVVRMRMASICGSDLHVIFTPMGSPRYPSHPGYPGHEGVGEVVESRHPGFNPGDVVLTVPHAWVGACFAEYQTLPGDSCIAVPATDVPLSHVLMAQQLGTVIYALGRRPLDATGKTALVLGQGSAGAFFTFLLRRAGAEKVVVVDREEARLAYGRTLGADVVVDASTHDARAAVKDATAGRGGDIVIEAVGKPDTLADSVELAAPDAELIWFGLPESDAPVPLPFPAFFRKRLSARSTFGAQGEPGLESFREALRIILAREIDVGPLLSHVFPIDDVAEAVAVADDRRDGALKVSISFD